MIRVVLESPFAGDESRNLTYLHRAIRDCLDRDEAPFASHLMYTQALDDKKPSERLLGISAGFLWGCHAVKCVVFADYGISAGMKKGMDHYASLGIPIEVRKIGKNKNGKKSKKD